MSTVKHLKTVAMSDKSVSRVDLKNVQEILKFLANLIRKRV